MSTSAERDADLARSIDANTAVLSKILEAVRANSEDIERVDLRIDVLRAENLTMTATVKAWREERERTPTARFLMLLAAQPAPVIAATILSLGAVLYALLYRDPLLSTVLARILP